MTNEITFEAFRDEWLTDITAGNPSTLELGRRFGRKILTQWLDIDDASDDLVYCDGSGDGGIDIAYLFRADDQEEDGEAVTHGHTWYLVQSKHGTAFHGTDTIVTESVKVIETLDGRRQRLSSLAEGLLERLTNFRRQASEADRLVLVLATEAPLTDDQKRLMDDVRAMGRNRLGPVFDVEAVSIATIHQRTAEAVAASATRVNMSIGTAASVGSDLLVQPVSLLSIYEFLCSYRAQTGDLDQLYEKNVRRFLGTKGRVNQAMQKTLKETPERFGLYNNGITIVVADFGLQIDGAIELVEPYVVNGCQTTRTIWEVCHSKLAAGGTGSDPALQEWRDRAAQGVVITKIVKVGSEGEELLQAITRYTNSQNAVREKDFLTLTSDFRTWAWQMADTYAIFLEIQRGGWDSQRALQRQKPSVRQFSQTANAFDLLKVYGAGWLGEAGTAFGRNAAFLPNGSIFKRIMNGGSEDGPFGVDDLYAAYRLQCAVDTYGFGRGASQASRRQTRFLCYKVALEILKDVLVRKTSRSSPKALTQAMLKLSSESGGAALQSLMDTAVDVIDGYLNPGTDDCVFKEPAFQNTFNNDLNGYLKWEQLGKTDEASPRLRQLLAVTKHAMGHKIGNQMSPREVITGTIFE